MAQLQQLIDIIPTLSEYGISNFIETGTGGGETLSYVKDYPFKLIQSCEIEPTQYEKLCKQFAAPNIKLWNGSSTEMLKKMLDQCDGPALIFLDAHFPGAGYVRTEFKTDEYSISDTLPLEKELAIIRDWKYGCESVIVVDDLRIYKSGNYEGGDWPERESLFGNLDSSFLYDSLTDHRYEEKLVHQGCIIYYPVISSVSVSHKDTATIGDFANSWPYLSKLAQQLGPLKISLPAVYSKFQGFKEFLEYQDFVKNVDFEDRICDMDVQSHLDTRYPTPRRSYWNATSLGSEIDRNLKLKVEDIEIHSSILDKTIIIDRTLNNVMRNTGWFNDTDKYYFLDFSMPMSYNINICLKAKNVIATFTGLTIILDLFYKEHDLIWFDDIDGNECFKDHYFQDRNTKLFYYKDYQNVINNTTV